MLLAEQPLEVQPITKACQFPTFNCILGQHLHGFKKLRPISNACNNMPEPTRGKMSKNVQAIEPLGYGYRPSNMSGPDGLPLWEIFMSTNPEKFITLLGYDIRHRMVTVYEAWNQRDDETRRLKLRDMILSFWQQKAGQPPEALRIIEYDTVFETTLQSLLSAIYEAFGPSNGRPLRVSASGRSRDERQAYQDLLTIGPFGNGAVKMLQEYASWVGKQSSHSRY